jgi:curved DNA-binding protein CbpA
MGQIFVLASGCDATQLNLTAAEGYLLSRFDGASPWRVLREMAGIPAAEADTVLGRWIEEGLLESIRTAGASDASNQSAGASPCHEAGENAEIGQGIEVERASGEARAIDEALIDEELDIDVATQRRILEFEASLDLPYHELLDVPKGSAPKVVKRAYFKLSKEFHPDRYFRREIGSHTARLERIFKKVLEAHELLSDPDLCQVENHSAATPVADAMVGKLSARESKAKSEVAAPKPLTKLERLRQRMPFKIDQSMIEERRAKAQEIFRAAETSQKAGRLKEAEASIRIAISFDPGRSEFKEALGGLRIQAAGARATKLRAKPSERMSDGELHDAWKLLEEVLIYRPHDPELNERAARVCLQLGKVELAAEYAQTLIDRAPDVAGSHTLMGRIQRELGDVDAASSAFESALKLDDEDLDARRALAALRLEARNQAQGGVA